MSKSINKIVEVKENGNWFFSLESKGAQICCCSSEMKEREPLNQEVEEEDERRGGESRLLHHFEVPPLETKTGFSSCCSFSTIDFDNNSLLTLHLPSSSFLCILLYCILNSFLTPDKPPEESIDTKTKNKNIMGVIRDNTRRSTLPSEDASLTDDLNQLIQE